MVKKFLILMVLAFSSAVLLPSETKAETISDTSVTVGNLNPSPSYQRNRARRKIYRAIVRRNNRNRRQVRRARIIRQVYYRNGRRYVRIIRVY